MTDQNTESSRQALTEEESKENVLTRLLQKRCILGILGFWCFFILSALRLNISLAIVAMVNWTQVRKSQNITVNSTGECHYALTQERPKKEDGPFLWDPKLQGNILGCYFYGLAATQLLGGRLSEMGSAKWVLFIGTLLATISTLLVPIAASDDGYAVMGLQILKGFGQGIMMPAFSVLMAKWVPAAERARFMSFIVSGMPVGGFMTVVFSGYICKTPSLGWKYVFYIFGAVGAVWCLIWIIIVHDTPLKHPRITRRELNRIMSLKSQKAPQMQLSVPLRSILTSKPVWAYFAVGFASFWALSLYVSVIPLFMGTILKFNIEENGVVSSVPNLVQAFVLICTSLLSDYLLKKKILRTTAIRKIFISIGLCSYALCMISVTFAGCNRVLSVFLLVMALGMSGFNFASAAVVPVDLSPRFAGTVSGFMNTFGALSGVIIPAIIGYLTENKQTINEWSYLFYASAAVCVVAVIIFLVFGSSETQCWNQLSNQPPQPSESDTDVVEDDNFVSGNNPSKKGFFMSKQNEKSTSKAVVEDDNFGSRNNPSRKGFFMSKQDEKSTSKANRKKREPMKDRPWRTDSFPDLPDQIEPTVIISNS